MAGRDVTLTVKVQDGGQVDAQTKSLERMKKAADDLNNSTVQGSVFGGKDAVSDLTQQQRLTAFLGKDLPQASGKATEAIAAVESASTGTASSLGFLASAAGPVGIAIAAIAVSMLAAVSIAIGLTHEITSVTKAFADYGNEIGKSMNATGLAAQTISALRHEADATGTSFGQVESAANSLRQTIGEAAAGSVLAQQKLKLLGIDGPSAIYSVDAAFKTALATIVKLPGGMEQTNALFAAFGEEGYKLLPFLESFHGNVDLAIAKARELGVALSGEDVSAAREFQRAFSDVQAQIQGITYTFGREFLPTVDTVLTKFSDLLNRNEAAIHRIAEGAGIMAKDLINALKSVQDYMDEHPGISGVLLRAAKGALMGPGVMIADPIMQAIGNGINQQINQTPLQGQMGGTAMNADPSVLENERKERLRLLLQSSSSEIQAYETSASETVQTFQNTLKALEDAFAQNHNVEEFKSRVTSMRTWFVSSAQATEQQLEAVEGDKLRLEGGTDERLAALKEKWKQRNQQIYQADAAAYRAEQDKLMSFDTKSMQDHLADVAAAQQRSVQLAAATSASIIQISKNQFDQGLITEKQYNDVVRGETNERLRDQKTAIQIEIDSVHDAIQKRADMAADLNKKLISLEGQKAVVTEQIHTQVTVPVLSAEEKALQHINALLAANNAVTVERRRTAAANEKDSLVTQLTALQDAFSNGGVNDGLKIAVAHWQDIVNLSNKELDAVIAIDHAQTQLDHQMDLSATEIRSKVLSHLAEQKTLVDGIADGINKTYDAVSQKLDDQIDKMFKWAGAFSSLFAEPIKAIMGIGIGKLTTGLMDAIMPSFFKNQTNNPIAKPIVSAIDETNKLLTMLVMRSGGGSAGVGLGGLNLGGLLSGVGGMGPGGTPYFNPNGGTIGRGAIPPTGTITIGPDGQPMYTVNGNQPGGDIVGNLRQLFSLKPGGIFGSQGFGNNVGTYQGIGAIASLFGGLLGGRVGGTISGAGSGLSIGASIGAMFGPGGIAIGAIIGAAAGGLLGLLSSLFGNSKQRKQDEATRNQGMLDALASINKAYDDVTTQLKFGQIDPASAITQASSQSQQVRAQYLQMANGLTDKKTRNIALADVSRLDTLISTRDSQLRALADRAQASADIAKRILPEFAGGTYFADYFRPNGLIPGVFDSRDDMMAMLSRGEMVLNPTQQAKVRRQAGFDVFAGAGIPNYPSPNMAGGGTVTGTLGGGSITINPSFTIELVGVPITDSMQAYLVSDDGERVMVDLVKRKKKSGDI